MALKSGTSYIPPSDPISELYFYAFEVDVTVLADDRCREFYGEEFLDGTMLCAGHEEGGVDACQVRLEGLDFVFITEIRDALRKHPGLRKHSLDFYQLAVHKCEAIF